MAQDYRAAMAALLEKCAQRLSRIGTPPGGVEALAAAVVASEGRDEASVCALALALAAELVHLAGFRRARAEDVLFELRRAAMRPLTREGAAAVRQLTGRIQSSLEHERRGEQREQARREKVIPPSPPSEIHPADRLDLEQRLARLKPSDRGLLIEAGAYGLDHNDLAEEFGVAPGTVRNRLVESRRQARETPARVKQKGRP